MSSRCDEDTREITSQALVNALQEVEARFPVMEWEIGGLQLWPLIRMNWFFSHWDAAYRLHGGGGKWPRARRLLEMMQGRAVRALARFSDRGAEDHAKGGRDVVFLSDGVSFVQYVDRWYERFCDPLIERLRDRGYSTLLLTQTHRYLRPRWSRSLFIQPELDIAGLAGLVRATSMTRFARLPEYASVRAAFAAQDLDHPMLDVPRLIADAARIQSVARTFGQLLDECRPKLAFVVSYYSIAGVAFVLACRRRSIPVVDMQHGVFSPLHPAYGSFPRSASKLQLVPDWFWVWSTEDARTVHSWSGENGAHRAVLGGNPWLTMWLYHKSADSRRVDEHVRRMRASRPASIVVLVTLQTGLAHKDRLEWMANLMRAAGDRCAWWIRMHPSMTSGRHEIYDVLAHGGCSFELDGSSDLPLYALLHHVDVHLTHSSSTVIEAEKFGVKSVLTSVYGAELFPQQLANGVAVLTEGSHADVLKALLEQAARRGQLLSEPDNTDEALDQLLQVAARSNRMPA